MPKIFDTRKDKAKELLRMVTDGPSTFGHGWTPEQTHKLKDNYKLWSESWVIPLLKELVPELRPKKPNSGDPIKLV